jgi:mannose-6-phosphate isomerase-like protein (cupin superfamily)
MCVGDESSPVGVGDAIAIPPGVVHRITNTGSDVLKFLCCCAPGYEHEDTILADQCSFNG